MNNLLIYLTNQLHRHQPANQWTYFPASQLTLLIHLTGDIPNNKPAIQLITEPTYVQIFNCQSTHPLNIQPINQQTLVNTPIHY